MNAALSPSKSTTDIFKIYNPTENALCHYRKQVFGALEFVILLTESPHWINIYVYTSRTSHGIERRSRKTKINCYHLNISNLFQCSFQEECIDVLKVVKSRINSQQEDISSHLLLSIFKIAEVDVVYPTPPSSAYSIKPNKNIYVIIVFLTILYHLKNVLLIAVKRMVNLISNLFDSNRKAACSKSISCFEMVPFEKKYFVNNNFVSILESYDEFIDSVDVVITTHAFALDDAQYNTDQLNIRDIDVNIYKETKHIIKAVSTTISTYLNELVADAIILKYFSRDVYYGCTNSKLFGEFFFEKKMRPLLMGLRNPLA